MTRTSSPSRSTFAAVAERSGVSKSTVSRVLNDHYPKGFSVRPEVKERVLQAARELDFKPNPFVRSLKAKKTRLISLLGLRDFGWSSRGVDEHAINALIEALSGEGYEVSTSFIRVGTPDYQPPRWRVDGAVVIGNSSTEQLADLDASGVPYVTINGPAGPSGGAVQVDDTHGAESAVEHLLQHGHRRIAYLHTLFDDTRPTGAVQHVSELVRQQAFDRAMKAAGLEPVTPSSRRDWTAPQAIEEAVVQQGATAIVSYQHVMAVQQIAAAQRAGLRVPQDVSVLCFNDAFPTAEMYPSISTMSLPGTQMGREAAAMLLRMIEGGESGRVLLPESLIARESTATCPRPAP